MVVLSIPSPLLLALISILGSLVVTGGKVRNFAPVSISFFCGGWKLDRWGCLVCIGGGATLHGVECAPPLDEPVSNLLFFFPFLLILRY